MSAYALHIWNNRHEYGTAEERVELLKPCNKGTWMNCWEAFYMQAFRQHKILIKDQQENDINTLYELACTCPDRPWGPPSLLYNGYWVFPGGKVWPGRDADPLPSSSDEVKNGVELYLYSPHGPTWLMTGWHP
jgi:hypothetical protein